MKRLPLLTREDLALIQELGSRSYSDNSLSSNCNEFEKSRFRSIKHDKLKPIAQNFMARYENDYGPFECSISSGNPLTRAGTLNRVWSGLFKGSENKQYSTQISFVLAPKEMCLEVGFYFGRSSSRSGKLDLSKLSQRMNSIAKKLSERVLNDPILLEKYEQLFDHGFQAYSKGKKVAPIEWLHQITESPKNSQIQTKIYLNDEGIIDSTRLSTSVSMIIFLMSLVPSWSGGKTKKRIPPLSPEQRADQAALRTLIGYKGEKFIFEIEERKLKSVALNPNQYLRHVSLESDHFGYDIESSDSNGNVMFIEVKTTTRIKEDPRSQSFYLSANEFEYYKKNKHNYYLYRVYAIDSGNPSFEIIDLKDAKPDATTFLVSY